MSYTQKQGPREVFVGLIEDGFFIDNPNGRDIRYELGKFLTAYDQAIAERDEYVHEAEHFQNKCIDLDQANGMLSQERDQALALLREAREALDFASEILTLTHPDLSEGEVSTLTTRQYKIWSRSAKSDAGQKIDESGLLSDRATMTKTR